MYISVLPSDDYANTYGNVPATGNVLTNDIDPEGNTLVATPQSVTVPQGTLQLLANGQYTFTPAPGATGAADFTYTVCDNGQPQACGEGTLHILVDKGPDYTPGILGDSYTFLGADTTKDFIVTISNTNTINKGAIRFFLPQYLPNLSISVDPAATLSGVYGGFPVANQDWNIQLQGSFMYYAQKRRAVRWGLHQVHWHKGDHDIRGPFQPDIQPHLLYDFW